MESETNMTTLPESWQRAPGLATLSRERRGTHWIGARGMGPPSSEEAHMSHELQLAGHTYHGTSLSPVSVWHGGRSMQPSAPTHTEEGTGTVWGPGPVARLLPPRPWTCQSPSLGMTDFQVGGLEQKAVFQHFFFKQQKPFLSLLKKDASLFLPGLPGGMKSLPRRRPEVGQGSPGSPERSGSLRAGGITFLPMQSSREAAERTPRLGSCHQALTVA